MKLLIFAFTLLSFFAGTTSAQTSKIASIYTNLNTKICKTLEQSDEGTGSYLGECPGFDKYKLQVSEGDIRQSINIVAPNKKIFELDLIGNVSTAFSSVGEKAEWRVVRNGKTVTPIALIIRYNASENQEDSTQLTSYLVVAKITKNEICVTDVVKPTANANAEARKLADASAEKPCKSNED